MRLSSPASRVVCTRCLRPARVCLCALACATPHRTPVLVLQHPQEQRQAKNSVALLRLSLAHCEVVVGERFSDEQLDALLHRPGQVTRLLYPEVAAAPAPAALPIAPDERTHLLVIDATWRKSLRLLLEHPRLQALPRLALAAPPPTRYRAIRTARRSDQVSTLEATLQALAQLEGTGFDGAPLLAAFGHFVEREAARRQPPAGQGDAEHVAADGRALIRDGLPGAHHSHGPGYGEDVQGRRPSEAGMRTPRGTRSALP